MHPAPVTAPAGLRLFRRGPGEAARAPPALGHEEEVAGAFHDTHAAAGVEWAGGEGRAGGTVRSGRHPLRPRMPPSSRQGLRDRLVRE